MARRSVPAHPVELEDVSVARSAADAAKDSPVSVSGTGIPQQKHHGHEEGNPKQASLGANCLLSGAVSEGEDVGLRAPKPKKAAKDKFTAASSPSEESDSWHGHNERMEDFAFDGHPVDNKKHGKA